MLPYTPLHLLLFTYDDDLSVPDALVMTSANESGAPSAITMRKRGRNYPAFATSF